MDIQAANHVLNKALLSIEEGETADMIGEGGFVIGARGLEEPSGKELRLQPNTAYWIGASSSPHLVIVDRISGGMVSYHDPYDKKRSGAQEWVFRDLAAKGINTWLKTYAKYQPEMAKTMRALLAGKKVRPNGADFDRFKVIVQGEGEEDLWRAAETYGSVGGFVDTKNKFEISLERSALDELKKDKRFTILKTTQM